MKRWIPVAALAVALFAAPSFSVRADDDDAKAIAEEVTTKGAKTFDTQDAKAMAAQYLDHARLTIITTENDEFKAQVREGRAEAEKYYAELFENPQTIKSRNTVDRAKFLGDDVLSIDGTFDVNTLDPKSIKVPFHQVRVKKDGEWRVLLMEISILPKK